jgi:hypothetical protein
VSLPNKSVNILTATLYRYYNSPNGIEPQFYYLYRVPEKMGYEVDYFDYETATRISIENMRRVFLKLVRGGKYDAVFVATHQDEFDTETLAEASKYSAVFGWNSDDEWRWEDYSSRYVHAYTYMVTNSPIVFAAHKQRHPNLLYAQWACTGLWDGRIVRKDIDFSFVGQVYGTRREQIKLLSQRADLKAFGRGTGYMGAELTGRSWKATVRSRLKPWAARLFPEWADDTLSFEQVNAFWNRSRISFTPLDSSSGSVRQIKSRVFDMGLSGTLMLGHRAPGLDCLYEPGVEYVPFETLEECVEKAKFYLRNETARHKIAEAYAQRTLREHLWEHRIRHVLREAGLLHN